MTAVRASLRFPGYLALAFAVTAACGAHSPTATPAPDTRAEVRDAEVAERARRHDLARSRYETAIAHARDRESVAYARSRFGETLLTWGEYDEGAAQLEASVEAYPNDPQPWHNLGLVREHMGKLDAARVAFDRARALAPSDWRPRIALAALKWHFAARCFRGALPHEPCTNLVVAAQREYRELLALEIPRSLRDKVQWALQQLELPQAGLSPVHE